jgi:phosphoadenosine phosphosulfate reductase
MSAPARISRDRILQLQASINGWSAEHILKWAFDTFRSEVAISSAFGVEGMAVIDMAARLRGSRFRVLTIDTQLLFPETYDLMLRVQRRYGIAIERIYPLQSPEDQAGTYGMALWRSDPHHCCTLRKVEPLRRKLTELSAWITAIRRDQTPIRATAHKIEWDCKFDLVKLNPIIDWSSDDVWRYVYKHRVPYNVLHERNYPSIGCVPCTRPVEAGESARAGRWAGFAKTECGLHTIEPAHSAFKRNGED